MVDRAARKRLALALASVLVLVGLVFGGAMLVGALVPKPESDLPPSTGPWTVGGILPGMTLAECETVLGKATRTSREPARSNVVSIAFWDNLPAQAFFDLDSLPREPVANAVWGPSLIEKNGRIALSPASTEADVRATLPDATVQVFWQPGFMGIGGKRDSVEFLVVSDTGPGFRVITENNKVTRVIAYGYGNP